MKEWKKERKRKEGETKRNICKWEGRWKLVTRWFSSSSSFLILFPHRLHFRFFPSSCQVIPIAVFLHISIIQKVVCWLLFFDSTSCWCLIYPFNYWTTKLLSPSESHDSLTFDTCRMYQPLIRSQVTIPEGANLISPRDPCDFVFPTRDPQGWKLPPWNAMLNVHPSFVSPYHWTLTGDRGSLLPTTITEAGQKVLRKKMNLSNPVTFKTL